MLSLDGIIDQKTLLVVLIIGTFFFFFFIPLPNIIYKDQQTHAEILNFKENSGCYGVHTEEITCPHGS